MKAPGRPDLSYARLVETVRSIRGQLCEMGVGRADRVAIVLPNGPEMAVAFMAVSSCAVCAPLNPAYCAAEFDFYLSDLQARALIAPATVDSPAIKVAAEQGIPVFELRSLAEAGSLALAGRPCGPPNPAGASEAGDVALVLHTSGTTSRPKMVPLTHQNLYQSAISIARWFSLTESDCCLNIMPLFHIHGLIGAVLSSLSAGACAACAPGSDATKFFDWVRRLEPTWYTAVPTMHQAILARAGQHSDILETHRLRFIRSCSSALAPELMRGLEEAFRVPVVESYGMTEASHQIASNPLPPRHRKPGSVGLAAGPDVSIMDQDGNLLGPGQKGEIVLRGETVTPGYIGNPDANKKSFTGGWFRTGDEGFLDDEAYLFISARIKEIINRGGEKISPREIDEVLLKCPGVSQAVAFAIPHAQLGEEVGAAVVLRPDAVVSESELRQFAAGQLAYFKVPRVIRIVEEIPKGATGKIQRIGLSERFGIPAMDDAAAPKAEFRGPGTALEKKLVEIWEEILAVRQIGVDDSFFAAGGDSILATALILRLTREIGAAISLVEFIETPTIAAIAAKIESRKRGGAPSSGTHLLVPIQPAGNALPLFCTPGLEGSLVDFVNLSRHLGPDQPIFAFANAQMAPTPGGLTLEQMAEACIQALRSAQRSGPYRLVGKCFGGYVAYEMARQLSRNGERIDLLVMLDCFNHRWRRELPVSRLLLNKARHGFARSRLHLSRLSRPGNGPRLSYLAEHFGMLGQTLRNAVLQRAYDFCVDRRRSIPHVAADLRYENRRAERMYRRLPYGGRVLMLKTTDPAGGIYPIPLMGWKGLLQGRVDEYAVPGDHLRMLVEPAVTAVARLLRKHLDELQKTEA